MIEAVAVILGLFSASIFLAFAIDAYLARRSGLKASQLRHD